MEREEDRVHRIMQDYHQGTECGNKLKYDPQTKTIRPSSWADDPDKTISVTPQDMQHFGGR